MAIGNEPNAVQSSEIFRFYDQGSERLIVWFGGINEPFVSANLAEATSCDTLALVDHRRDWYTLGILPEHSSPEHGINFLRRYIHDRSYKRVIFGGQSSGGYGALYYAYHCNIELCIAFSPQTANEVNGQCKRVPNVELVNLGDLYRQGSTTRLVLNASRSEKDHEAEFFWDDWRSIRRLEDYEGSTIVRHPYDNHALTVMLRRDNSLYSYISGLILAYCS
jgi:hypothetical protein